MRMAARAMHTGNVVTASWGVGVLWSVERSSRAGDERGVRGVAREHLDVARLAAGAVAGAVARDEASDETEHERSHVGGRSAGSK